MKIYLAGAWNAKPEVRDIRLRLERMGHTVTSRWIDWAGPLSGEAREQELRRSASVDLEDIRNSDMVLIFTCKPSTHGGFHTELGYALALGKRVEIIGPRPSNFFHLPEVSDFTI